MAWDLKKLTKTPIYPLFSPRKRRKENLWPKIYTIQNPSNYFQGVLEKSVNSIREENQHYIRKTQAIEQNTER